MPALYGEAECVSLPSMPSLGVHFKDRCFVPQLAAHELHIPDRASGDINGLEVFTLDIQHADVVRIVWSLGVQHPDVDVVTSS